MSMSIKVAGITLMNISHVQRIKLSQLHGTPMSVYPELRERNFRDGFVTLLYSVPVPFFGLDDIFSTCSPGPSIIVIQGIVDGGVLTP